MRKRLVHIGLLALTASCGLQLMAKPAKQGLFTVSQADGTALTVRLAGDEYYHQYFTEDGFPLFEREGNFYYGDIDAQGNVVDSGIRATQAGMRSEAARTFLSRIDMEGLERRIVRRADMAPRRMAAEQAVSPVRSRAQEADGNDGPPYERGYGLFPDQRFPAYGDQKAIVILVEYTDVKFNTNYQGGVTAGDYFTRMLNEDGFNDYGGTGCAAEFFRLNSGNSFRPEFLVYGPITLAHNQAYYGGNDWSGDDQNPAAMVKEACDALDDIVDFREFDRNNDGLVDNIFIFYAGRGEASGGGSNTVWPHSWNMTSAGYSDSEVSYDGVRVYTYGCSNEWEDGRPDGVGTFVHEFSHVMGLPDLYATSYTSSFTPGSWSALDYGPYNNDGMTPPLYGAFERYALGWLKPWEIDKAVSATLPPISDNVCGIIRTSDPKEFFLLENRQQESWDAYIPGHGMLIWHVDYDDYVWKRNVVNNSPGHQYCDIEEADGTQSEYSRSGDSFPGTANKTSFTASTSPAMKTWSNVGLDFPITEIAEANGLITFKVLEGSTEPLPTVEPNEATEVEPDALTLNWEPAEEGYDVILNVYTRPENSEGGPARLTGTEIYVPGFRNKNMGNATSVRITGLEEETLYYFTVATSNGWETSEPSDEQEAFTGTRTLDYQQVKTLEASNVNETSFTANWEKLASANEYLITVYEMLPTGTYQDVCDFTNGVDNIGGWSSSSKLSYGMEAYCGEAVPSLRLSSGGTLSSPVYDDAVKTLSFWSRGNNTTTGDMINVYAVTAEGQSLVEEVPVSKSASGVVTEVNNLPADTRQIVLEFNRVGDKGALAIDDVKVGYGTTYEPSKLAAFDGVSAGDADSYKVEGLKNETNYGYTVVATDGTLVSKVSKMQPVTTHQPSGVNSIDDAQTFSVSVSDLTVTCTADEEIVVADYTGALVARGSHKVTLPRAGLYVVTVPAKNYAKKIIVR